MGLYERLAGQELPKIPIHAFVAAAAEVARGHVTAITAAGWFALSVAERTEAQTLINRVQTAAVTRIEVCDVLYLLEAGHRTIAQVKTRLGV